MALTGAHAGGRRLLRLGLAAGSASIGAVAVSLLLGGAAASAVDDDSLGLPSQAAGVVGSAVPAVAEPADALVSGLASATAPVAQAAVDAPPAIVESAPAVAAEPVLVEAVQPVLVEAVQPLLEPLAPVTEPVAALGQRAADVVAPALEPIAEAVEGAIDSAPIADELLADAPVLSPPPVLEAPVDEPGLAAAEPGGETGDLDASATASQEPGVVSPAARSVAQAPPLIALIAVPPPGPDAGPGPGAPATAPSGAASGAAGGQPPAITHAHFSPQLTGGSAGAVENDRVPASPVEELASSPD